MVFALLAPWVELPCDLAPLTTEYENHDYVNDPCILVRYARLGFMTKRECDHIRRIAISMVCGTIIGRVAPFTVRLVRPANNFECSTRLTPAFQCLGLTRGSFELT